MFLLSINPLLRALLDGPGTRVGIRENDKLRAELVGPTAWFKLDCITRSGGEGGGGTKKSCFIVLAKKRYLAKFDCPAKPVWHPVWENLRGLKRFWLPMQPGLFIFARTILKTFVNLAFEMSRALIWPNCKLSRKQLQIFQLNSRLRAEVKAWEKPLFCENEAWEKPEKNWMMLPLWIGFSYELCMIFEPLKGGRIRSLLACAALNFKMYFPAGPPVEVLLRKMSLLICSSRNRACWSRHLGKLAKCSIK